MDRLDGLFKSNIINLVNWMRPIDSIEPGGYPGGMPRKRDTQLDSTQTTSCHLCDPHPMNGTH